MGNVVDITEKLVERQSDILDTILQKSCEEFNENHIEFDVTKEKLDNLIQAMEKDLKKEKMRVRISNLVLTGIGVVICFGIAVLVHK